jgi:hypothetical protein
VAGDDCAGGLGVEVGPATRAAALHVDAEVVAAGAAGSGLLVATYRCRHPDAADGDEGDFNTARSSPWEVIASLLIWVFTHPIFIKYVPACQLFGVLAWRFASALPGVLAAVPLLVGRELFGCRVSYLAAWAAGCALFSAFAD